MDSSFVLLLECSEFPSVLNFNVHVDVSHLLCNTAFTYRMNSHKQQNEAGYVHAFHHDSPALLIETNVQLPDSKVFN
jgi:hypothetical protein